MRQLKLTMRVEEQGAGGRAIVFVHGGGLDRRAWDRVWSLRPDSQRWIRYDRRGLGESIEAPPGGSHVEDLATLLRERSLDNVVLVGASVGAAICLEVAVRHPESVAGLVLLSPLLPDRKLSQQTKDRIRVLLEAARGQPEELGDAYLGDAHLTRGISDDGQRRWLREVVMANRMAWTSQKATASPGGLEEILGQIRVPVRVLSGAEDDVDNRAMAERIASRIDGAELMLIADCGHLPELVHPRLVAETISRAFVR